MCLYAGHRFFIWIIQRWPHKYTIVRAFLFLLLYLYPNKGDQDKNEDFSPHLSSPTHASLKDPDNESHAGKQWDQDLGCISIYMLQLQAFCMALLMMASAPHCGFGTHIQMYICLHSPFEAVQFIWTICPFQPNCQWVKAHPMPVHYALLTTSSVNLQPGGTLCLATSMPCGTPWMVSQAVQDRAVPPAYGLREQQPPTATNTPPQKTVQY